MKNLFFTVILLTTLHTTAGDKIGNGGGIWACYASDKSLQKGLLIDFFELKNEFALELIQSAKTDPMEIVKDRMNFAEQNLPGLNNTLKAYISDTLDNLRFIDSELLMVDDGLFRIKPSRSSCATEWKYEQFANYTQYKQVLINREFWESSQIPALDKAGLIWHEIIYSWLRDRYSDTNSVRARQITGLLFSNLDKEQIDHQINQVLANLSVPQPKPPGSYSSTLYVASGLCYSGSGITTYTGATSSKAVTKWNTDTGTNLGVLADLSIGNNVSINTTPQALIDQGSDILLLTENSLNFSDRKIYRIKKADPTIFSVYSNDPTAFTAVNADVTRSMAQDADRIIMFSKSTAIERIDTLGVRIVKGRMNPWVNPRSATGTCFTAAASFIPQIALMNPYSGTKNGKLIYLHAGNTANANRIGIIQRTGLTSGEARDCAGSNPVGGVSAVAHKNAVNLSGPVSFLPTGASLTSMVYIQTPPPANSTGKLIVSYSASANIAFDNNVNFNFGIVMWDIHESSDTVATITNPVILWRDESVVWAPSAMAYHPSTGHLYVAVGGSPGSANQTTQAYGYNIEKFKLHLDASILTRISRNNQPFITGNSYLKCISSMVIGK